MIALYFFIKSLFSNVRMGLKDDEFRGLFYSVVVVLVVGTVFYNQVEGWSILDSFYFTVVALTTVGFGDFSPETDIGKLFTVLYLVIGLGLLSSFIIQMAQFSRQRAAESALKRRLGSKSGVVSAPEDQENKNT